MKIHIFIASLSFFIFGSHFKCFAETSSHFNVDFKKPAIPKPQLRNSFAHSFGADIDQNCPLAIPVLKRESKRQQLSFKMAVAKMNDEERKATLKEQKDRFCHYMADNSLSAHSNRTLNKKMRRCLEKICILDKNEGYKYLWVARIHYTLINIPKCPPIEFVD